MTKLIAQYVVAHSTVVAMGMALVGTAIASTWPDQRPKTMDEWWNWLRDLVHQLGNAKRPTNKIP